MERDLFGAPFWSKGGLLYVHLLLPHPPSVSGETQLADAYAANVARAKELVFDVLGRLGQGPSRDDFALVITSDHHLRSEVWCKVEPYVRHDCQLPAEMLTAEIPFIVANRGAGPLEQVPHSNADLLAVVAELSRPR
jgi:hypothetical protein